MRIKRGTLRSERQGGRVFVLLGPDRPTDHATERTDLTHELRDRLHYVEGQLEAERQAHAEARRLLAAALERIPAIEAPPEAPESTETEESPAPEEPRRGFWSRLFGG